MRDGTVPACKSLKVFGNEASNYDEAKRFCYFGDRKNQTCVVYSVGGNNQWDFEEYMHHGSNCDIETFDCTVNATVPLKIKDRTRFHKICLGASNSLRNGHQRFLTLHQMNKVVGRASGPDYFKMDIEGFEWAVLKAMIHSSYMNAALDKQLPQQIYSEFHLNMDSDPNTNAHIKTNHKTGHVGNRLKHFLDDMFIKGGYMIMTMRTAKMKANTDILFAKVFCAR